MVKNHYRWDFIGLSSDTKPTPETSEKVVDGSTFYTSDNSKLYVWCKDNWYEKTVSGGGGSDINVVQTTGTSTTDVMSQNATTDMVYDSNSKYRIRIKYGITGDISSGKEGVAIGGSVTGNGGIAILNGKANTRGVSIGYHGTNSQGATAQGSVAIGAHSNATSVGEMNIGSSDTSYGYNSSNYRLLTGLYDGQSAHDAATYGQVISYSAINGAGAPTTATEGKYVGQLYYDTTNEDMYFLKTIDTTTTPTTYTWEALGGGSSVNVVQTTGTSTTDVMSQKAVTDTLFYSNMPQKVQIGIGADSDSGGNYSSIAIGNSSKAKGGDTIAIGSTASALAGDTISLGRDSSSAVGATNSVAIGRLSSATAMNAVAIGTRATATQQGQFDISTGSYAWGYNNSSYRLLTGLYDGQSAHDAATKGQLDAISSYSETEVNTGATWIDGKQIYKKSYQHTITVNSGASTFSLGIANLYEIVKIEAIWHVGGTLTNGLPTTFSTVNGLENTISIMAYGGTVEISSNGRKDTTGVLTFYYTKSA